MLLEIKLFSGLICMNQSLPCHGLNRFQLELQESSTLEDIFKLLNLSPSKSLVSIVNGHAQLCNHVINEDCNISIFLPMSDRQHDFFEKI